MGVIRAASACWGIGAVGAALLSGCASSGPNMVASFHDMSAAKFSVRAVAAPEVIREYVICKAIWMAEKRHVTQISLSNPIYGPPTVEGPLQLKFPDNWVSVETTAYLGTVGPEGNPLVNVQERAGLCRKGWDWYV